jgi:hypothetical protein
MTGTIPRSRRRLGRPVGDCDPLVLGVHPAIQVLGTGSAAVLPEYVPRAHDGRLRETVGRMLEDGRSRLVTLVGGSSTGKTRTCWELVRYLEQQQSGRWWLWHPYDPTHPDAALAELHRVGPGTIVWLNEAQLYLQPTDTRLGERIAAGFRTLLHDRQRGPVLVLATLWLEFWDGLTFRPQYGKPDLYAQARDLLAGSRVSVAGGFTPGEVAGLAEPGVIRGYGRPAPAPRVAGSPSIWPARLNCWPDTRRRCPQIRCSSRLPWTPVGSGTHLRCPTSCWNKPPRATSTTTTWTASPRTGWNRPWNALPDRARAPVGR